MKYILIFLFSMSAFAQDNNLSVISAERATIVYRGIDNLIKVAVPGIENKDVTVTCTGGYIKPAKGEAGNYLWNVTSAAGNRAKIITAYKIKGKEIIEEKEFRIQVIERPYAYLGKYHYGCQSSYKMTRSEISEMEVKIIIDNYYGELEKEFYKPTGFVLYLPKDTIYVKGNTLPPNIKEKVQRLQKGSLIILDDIRQYNPQDYCLIGLRPIVIEVVDDALPYKEELPIPVTYIPEFHILYRGIENKLKISVPKSKSFTAIAPGLKKVSESYDYTFNVSPIKEDFIDIDFEITLPGDSLIYYKERYEIMSINMRSLINNMGCNGCIVELSVKQLENAIISVSFDNVIAQPFRNVQITGFIIELPNNDFIKIDGNKINSNHVKEIRKFKPGSQIIISNIHINVPSVNMVGTQTPPIKIILK